MPADRFFLPLPLTSSTLEIKGTELHHLRTVMRKQVGDGIEIVNGCGEKVQGSILSLDSKKATIHPDFYERKPPPPPVVLAQALCRFSLLEWIIEKGCELDATEFWLFAGEKSDHTEIFPRQKERLESLLIAALKQCGRFYLPKIVITPPLTRWQKGDMTILFGDLEANAIRMPPLQEKTVVFCVGPEKGFSSQEIAYLRGTLGAQGVRLHRNILRTETAGIVALSQLFSC